MAENQKKVFPAPDLTPDTRHLTPDSNLTRGRSAGVAAEMIENNEDENNNERARPGALARARPPILAPLKLITISQWNNSVLTANIFYWTKLSERRRVKRSRKEQNISSKFSHRPRPLWLAPSSLFVSPDSPGPAVSAWYWCSGRFFWRYLAKLGNSHSFGCPCWDGTRNYPGLLEEPKQTKH